MFFSLIPTYYCVHIVYYTHSSLFSYKYTNIARICAKQKDQKHVLLVLFSNDPIDQSAMPSSCQFATAMPFCASSEMNFSSSDTRNTM